jgi:hypothetical protein
MPLTSRIPIPDVTLSGSQPRCCRRTWSRFLGTGDLGRRAAEQAIEAAAQHAEMFGARTSYAAQEVRLLAPVPRPRVIRDFLTFEGHMLTAGKALGRASIPPVWYEVPAYYKAIRTPCPVQTT